ncbi:hypothetical protein R3Q06_13620 [Rhodococcus erythropolis]|uniref:ATP-grasp domain-containing protein n=1 Tax=Rhodococcus erythropolis TaxID=1833 RepID=UPI0029492180|nr:hypothetical protein [Rhodococcus erythropolis]MDV6274536.1 hypothetical protein [Rhodococcus erythropolis]
MTTVLLLTCDGAAREADVESKLVMEALTTYGIASTMAPWSSPSLRDIDADLVLIRSTWDYTQRLDEFLAVLDQLTVRIANPLAIVKWNAHKGYLTELAAAGIPIVPTAVLTAGKSETLTLPSFESADVIVKPAVSAGAVGVGKFSAGSAQAHAHLSSILESGNDALVQPFISDVVDGERSSSTSADATPTPSGKYRPPTTSACRNSTAEPITSTNRPPPNSRWRTRHWPQHHATPANCFMRVWTSWGRWINHCSWKWN